MSGILVDTSVWILVLRESAEDDLTREIRSFIIDGSVATCGMIMLELLGGTRTVKEYQELKEELEALRFTAETEQVWHAAWQLSFKLRRKGLTIPSTDILIASVALEHGLSLWHADQHFEYIAKISDLRTHIVRAH